MGRTYRGRLAAFAHVHHRPKLPGLRAPLSLSCCGRDNAPSLLGLAAEMVTLDGRRCHPVCLFPRTHAALLENASPWALRDCNLKLPENGRDHRQEQMMQKPHCAGRGAASMRLWCAAGKELGEPGSFRAGEGQCGAFPVQSMAVFFVAFDGKVAHAPPRPSTTQKLGCQGGWAPHQGRVPSHLIDGARHSPSLGSFASAAALLTFFISTAQTFRHAAAAAPPIGGLHLDLGLFFCLSLIRRQRALPAEQARAHDQHRAISCRAMHARLLRT